MQKRRRRKQLKSQIVRSQIAKSRLPTIKVQIVWYPSRLTLLIILCRKVIRSPSRRLLICSGSGPVRPCSFCPVLSVRSRLPHSQYLVPSDAVPSVPAQTPTRLSQSHSRSRLNGPHPRSRLSRSRPRPGSQGRRHEVLIGGGGRNHGHTNPPTLKI